MVWRPNKRQAWWAIGMLIVLVILLLMGVWLWGVLSSYIQPKTPTDKKELVNIFVVIAAGVIGTLTVITAVGNLIISRRNLQNAHATLQQQRNLEHQRAQEDALQAYFKQMGDLMTAYNLIHTDRNDIKLLARAQTLSVAGRLDQSRKWQLLVFLSGAGLINKDATVVDISGADFSDADLTGVHLKGANLRDARLDDADLTGVHLKGANLTGADLTSANLEVATLRDANLRDARLSGAKLDGNYFFRGFSGGADLTGANLSDANLSDATLGEAILTGADLSGAKLSDANLNGADLSYANLSGATLRHANLTDAGVTKEQLVACKSVHGATMPDKQILLGRNNPEGPSFQDWLKSNGHVEDGENPAPS